MSLLQGGSVANLARDVRFGTMKDRDKALAALISLFKSPGRNDAVNELRDKGYHELFEDIFSLVILEKPNIRSSKKTAPRLAECAKAIRVVVHQGLPKFGRKTLLALVDHITQVLPGPHGVYIQPLLPDYTKALAELFSHQAHVELLARQEGSAWDSAVDCLLDIAIRHIPSDDVTLALQGSRDTLSTPQSKASLRSTSSTQIQQKSASADGSSLRDALTGLHHCVQAGNAPIRHRFLDIAHVVVRVLRLKSLSLGSLQTLCFAIANLTFASVQAEEFQFAVDLAKDLLPLMSFWWRAEKVSQDELIRAFRNEILKGLLLMHLHIEHLVVQQREPQVRKGVADLAEPIWTEYSKRSEPFRLSLADVIFSTNMPQHHFKLALFGLRPHNVEGESSWALLQNLAYLESILAKSKGKSVVEQDDSEDEEQPSKRRKVRHENNRLKAKMNAKDSGMKLTALQIIPFMIACNALSGPEIKELLVELAVLVADRNALIASWAMIACASCILVKTARDECQHVWRQLWHLATKLISLPLTSRTSCLMLHMILEWNLVEYSSISNDLNNIITSADVSGPGILCDTSIALMLHLSHVRNTRLPSATQSTSSHMIRWTFMRWNPNEASYASSLAPHVPIADLVNLFRQCCGLPKISASPSFYSSGGAVAETWKLQQENQAFSKYVLLLEDPLEASSYVTNGHQTSQANGAIPSDPAVFFASKKLILELLYSKLEDLNQVCGSWGQKSSDGGIQISPDRFQSVFSACIASAWLLPLFKDLNSSQAVSVEALLFDLTEMSVSAAIGSVEPMAFVTRMMQAVRSSIPRLSTSSLSNFRAEFSCVLKMFDRVSELVQPTESQPGGDSGDYMDMDEDMDSQNSRALSLSRLELIPRSNAQISLDPRAFELDTKKRLSLLRCVQRDPEQIGLVPQAFIKNILELRDDELLSCRGLLVELFRSDLVTSGDIALDVIERLGTIMSSTDYQSCEVALTTCIDVIDGLHKVWLQESGPLREAVDDLYHHLVTKCLPHNILSPNSQISFARLLFTLLRENSDYAADLGLTSCRTTFLNLLQEGPMKVKCYIASILPNLFELYILMLHDDIFVDVLNSLPADPEDTSGIAFRLLVLANLACRWSTLLRRCTYHIFETPGKISRSTPYGKQCMDRISKSLQLKSSRDLFALFSRQLLFTWLESDAVEDIPYSIFSFTSLEDLLKEAQAESTGLMMMRNQDDAVAELAKRLHVSEVELLRRNFTTALAYAMTSGGSGSSSSQTRSEERLRQKLGVKGFAEAIHLHFVDIVSLLLDLIDQEDDMEKVFSKYPQLEDAAESLKTIKGMAYSTSTLPPNQQPMSRAKVAIHELFRLCQIAEYSFHDVWAPAVVMTVARKLLNTINKALGSLHACSVLRKVRILVCLAGPTAYGSRVLETLLNSMRAFVIDLECADDALGVSQYLITRGSSYLSQVPSFLAGYALSTLTSLRVFLESSQSSTTQESQFKATMGKAQRFHGWLSAYLAAYDSARFQTEEQRQAFQSITEAASKIRSSGNAEKESPESKLLLNILDDEASEDKLLDENSRRVALGLLCSDFSLPSHVMDDVVATEEDATRRASSIWKSCHAQDLGANYLTWAGRVVGRAFSASGAIPNGIMRESRLVEYATLTPVISGSEHAILVLLQNLTSSSQSIQAGLAETALRSIVSQAIERKDNSLLLACEQSLTESSFIAAQWDLFRSPPSENENQLANLGDDSGWKEKITSEEWLSKLSLSLVRCVPYSILLSVLPALVTKVHGFAETAFPFIVHLVLHLELDQQQTAKHLLSGAAKTWLSSTEAGAVENQKLLINTILYLRTQEYPKESSIADRLQWLDIDYDAAAAGASRCSLYKCALLFAEIASSETSRASRRSSAAREIDPHDTLLQIFENIDDPDAYYGLPEEASLSNVLARAEYEGQGQKILAFRGAQYDSHIRLQDNAQEADSVALVNALSSLGHSGLSHSLLQTQQSEKNIEASLDNTFDTARRLEIWNLPAPTESDHHAVTLYKAYQAMHQATDISSVHAAIQEGFKSLIGSVTGQGMNAPALRRRLAALASLSELDHLVNIRGSQELDTILDRFQERSKWMRSGRYEDVSRILSSRGTTLSMLAQRAGLLRSTKLPVGPVRQLEAKSLILACGIHRHHQATQESLRISATLTHLVDRCALLNVHIDAAVNIEAANSLWDHGEMGSSIKMLQATDRDSSLRRQTITVSRADLLSKIGEKVSIARLEKPQDIQKKYLEPALRELKGSDEGRDAGLVFHQFAVFCDNQLQDPDGLEDLARLRSLRQGKSEEVAGLKALISSTKESQLKNRYNHTLSKERQWLELDEQELRRVEQTRSEFVKLSLENYLRSLIASDGHDSDALRFTALWLEKSEADVTNQAVGKYLPQVPTRKFASLMNQLTSRLQNQDGPFQKLLMNLVYSICVDHPYHGMYQIWSGTKAKAQKTDEVAVLRVEATEKVAQRIATTKSVANAWIAVEKGSKYYHLLAMDKNATKFKAGVKVALKDSNSAQNLVHCFTRFKIPPPTMHIEVSPTKDYSKVPITVKLEPTMSIASGVSAPKIITAIASDGRQYRQLVKGGNDDLRQDAIMEQVFAAVSDLLKLHRGTQQRNLGIRTYKVLPLTTTSGVIEFVPNTIPLHEFLMPAHERYYPKDLKGMQCRKEIFQVQSRTIDTRIGTYRKVTERFHPVMRYFFMEYFEDPDDWFMRRLAYTRSTAAISMLGHVLGLGDRHGHNILLDKKTGEAVHIDLGVAFEAGRILPVPELVPFRLTRDIVDGMGISKTEGVFRRCCEFTLDALREEQYSIMTILDVLRFDPLYTWSMSPLRLAKLQKARHTDEAGLDDAEQSELAAKTGKKNNTGRLNEPSEADRALEVVRKKLSKTLSVTATVNDLINQAADERNLAVLYSGWAAYA